MAGEKGATFASQLLSLFFNGTAIPNLAVNATSSPLTVLYGALHTADPTATGNQTSNEVTYTGYTRLSIARTSSGFTVSGASVSPTASLIWPTPTGAAGQTASFWSIGIAVSGAGQILYAGPFTPSQVITVGLPPTLTTASTISEA